MTVPLIGFDRWERRKAQLRAELGKAHATPIRTVKTRGQLEAENVSYWACGGMSFLRRQFAHEAQAARQLWGSPAVVNSVVGYRKQRRANISGRIRAVRWHKATRSSRHANGELRRARLLLRNATLKRERPA
jgi:hypothetical protein